MQGILNITIPELKTVRVNMKQCVYFSKIPLSLAKTLQDYIDSPDFETNRAQAIGKKTNGDSSEPIQKGANELVDIFGQQDPKHFDRVTSSSRQNNTSLDPFMIATPVANQLTQQNSYLEQHVLVPHSQVSEILSYRYINFVGTNEPTKDERLLFFNSGLCSVALSATTKPFNCSPGISNGTCFSISSATKWLDITTSGTIFIHQYDASRIGIFPS